MRLVDYYSSSSDSDADADHGHRPPAKKRRRASTSTSADNNTDNKHPISTSSKRKKEVTGLPEEKQAEKGTNTAARSTAPAPAPALPPLPPSFHDLYATTVRPFTTDLPSLHQGRRRVIPHVAGNWPSHIYVEWHPSSAHHAVLTSLVSALLFAEEEPASKPEPAMAKAEGLFTSFLTSDLGAPLPLHVSLSRPFVLRTEEKDAFHEELVQKVESSSGSGSGGGGGGGGGVGRFELRVDGLRWFRSPDAERSFLVLRVCSSSSFPSSHSSAAAAAAGAVDAAPGRRKNPELVGLLNACNAVVGAYGQPMLYARDPRGTAVDGKEGGGHNGDGGGGGAAASAVAPDATTATTTVDDGAFHVSIAWSFAEPTEEIQARTAAVFAREEFQRGIVEGIRIPVDGVKVKIGNVVTHIALAAEERKSGRGTGTGLFGI